jgi:xanthine dehydrogenase YagR molybdenum-binding subunit
LYNSPVKEVTYKIAKLNIGAPTFMRAPGETPGMFALESAMDELAHELKIDPVKLRTINHTKIHTEEKLPFSLENLVECYTLGAEKFGWSQRNMQPRMNRRGRYLVGYGMAAATYPATRSTATVKMQMLQNGTVKIFSATQDIGTGTYTIMAQTAADVFGVPVERISVEIGDSSLPPAPVSGGSTTAASITAAVLTAGEMLREDLLKLATTDGKSKLNGAQRENIDFAEAKFFIKNDSSKADDYADILKRNNKEMLEVCASGFPQNGGGLSGPMPPLCSPDRFTMEQDANNKKYSFHSFGAQFAEVLVDEDTGAILVSRFTSVMDIGRVLNEKTCRSQVIGGVVYGLGQTLHEETLYDKRYANPIQRSFADYHVPVQLDVPPIDVYFINKPDTHISPVGARGVGEIGITGVAAAVANAVFNATGKRIRNLPITPDKLL